MTLALKTKLTGYEKGDIRDAVSYALTFTVAQSQQRFTYYENACLEFERQFNMNSDEFMRQFESGELGDDLVYFDWYAAKRGLDIWRERRDILTGVSV